MELDLADLNDDEGESRKKVELRIGEVQEHTFLTNLERRKLGEDVPAKEEG